MGLYSTNTIKLETNIVNKHNVKKSKMAGGRPVCHIQSAAKELNSWQLRTNPENYKSSILTTQPN